MNDEERINTWRAALKDTDHPRSKTAWTLFAKDFNAPSAAKRLAEDKANVIEYCLEIIDTETLHYIESLGEGMAPINAIILLGEWQVVEVIPQLLRLALEEESGSFISDFSFKALNKMPAEAFDRVMEAGEAYRNTPEWIYVGSVLQDIDQENPKLYPYLLEFYTYAMAQEPPNESDVTFAAELMLYADLKQAVPVLKKVVKDRKLAKPARERIKKYLADVESGKWE